MGTDIKDDEIIAEVTKRLEAKYPDLPAKDVEAAVKSEFAELAGRPVRDYLSVLTERAAKKRLKRAS